MARCKCAPLKAAVDIACRSPVATLERQRPPARRALAVDTYVQPPATVEADEPPDHACAREQRRVPAPAGSPADGCDPQRRTVTGGRQRAGPRRRDLRTHDVE